MGTTKGLALPFFDKEYIAKKYNVSELLNYKIYGKSDSLGLIINSFTNPFNFLGNWIGDSIFRMDYEIRGNRKDLFIHNIIGLVTNWVNTIYPYILSIFKKDIPVIDIKNKEQYLYECFRLLVPVKTIASKIKNKKII